MSVLRFAEEFSRLVMSYMKDLHSIKDSTKVVIVPLSNEQIAFTVHHVLRALGVKDDESDNDDLVSNLVTSQTEVRYSENSLSKVELDQREKENESQDESQPAVINNSSLSDTTLKAIQTKTENSLENGLQSEKKYISRSNPAICVSVGRSDTFICKEDQKTNTDIQENVFKTPLNEKFLYSALEDIRKSVVDVTQKIDNLKKRTSHSTKQPRQLFSNSFLNFNHTMINKEPIKIHRSMTTFSGSSSVSSKLQVTGKTDILADRRKSIGSLSYGIATPRKSKSPKLDNSKSNLTESFNKLSPGLVPKLSKNPKYAHVKSTIPKPVSLNKKKVETVQ